MKIQNTKVLVNLEGEALKVDKVDLTLGKALSNVLLQDKVAGKMKLFLLAKKLFEEKETEVDASDLGIINKAVQTAEIYNALVLGQVELLLSEIK